MTDNEKQIISQIKKLINQLESPISSKPTDSTDSTDSPVMPFGKHKGQSIDDVPAKYLDWLRDQDFVRTDHPHIWKYITNNEDVIDSEIDDEYEDDEFPF